MQAKKGFEEKIVKWMKTLLKPSSNATAAKIPPVSLAGSIRRVVWRLGKGWQLPGARHTEMQGICQARSLIRGVYPTVPRQGAGSGQVGGCPRGWRVSYGTVIIKTLMYMLQICKPQIDQENSRTSRCGFKTGWTSGPRGWWSAVQSLVGGQ